MSYIEYTYDANNRLLAETIGSSVTLYTYDDNGNTLSAMKDGTLLYSYTYGLFGTQDSYTSDGVLYTYYTYRPDGLRHSIGDKIHLWDGANIVADVENTNITVYFRGINLICADEDGTQTYYHFNAHGDVVVLTNDIGEKEKTYSYTSFGVEYNPSTLDDNPFRYCGEYYDIESGNIYLRARYYNSDMGRFTQEDPIRDGRNWYSYCDSNPVVRIDKTGQAWETFWDISSLCCSIAEVIDNPKDPMNWLGAVGDLVDVLVPCLGGIGETIRVIDTAVDTAKVVDDIHDTTKVVKKMNDTAEAVGEALDTAHDVIKANDKISASIDVAKTKKLHRPYIRNSTREAVEKVASKSPDGHFLDANTKTPINGKYDLGHKYGNEFWRERDMAMTKGWTQKQFNDYMNNPKFYQIEDPVFNRMHIFEKGK